MVPALKRLLAEVDDPKEQAFIGTVYEEGHRMPRDIGTANSWYERAADGGDKDAETLLQTPTH